MARFHISIIRPEGYHHSSCFQETALGLRNGLVACGHEATLAENHINHDASTILLGAHLCTPEQALSLPSSVIVYNLEQLGISWTPSWYMRLAAWTQIWDYSPLNLERWRRVPTLQPPRLLEIGYDPQQPRIPVAPVQDIDILFYGSTTPRRTRILDTLREAGLHVHAIFGVYGTQRDAFIARAKIVLNLHAADSQIFELVRVSHLLANAKAVVTEQSADLGRLTNAVAVCTQHTVLTVCRRLLNDEAERHALEARGFECFSEKTQAKLLAEALGHGERARF